MNKPCSLSQVYLTDTPDSSDIVAHTLCLLLPSMCTVVHNPQCIFRGPRAAYVTSVLAQPPQVSALARLT